MCSAKDTVVVIDDFVATRHQGKGNVCSIAADDTGALHAVATRHQDKGNVCSDLAARGAELEALVTRHQDKGNVCSRLATHVVVDRLEPQGIRTRETCAVFEATKTSCAMSRHKASG